MSKNTSSNKFRTVDVDQYNEDNFKDDDGPVVQDKRGGLSATEIESLIQKGNNVEALKAVLSSAPIGNKNQAEKVINGEIYIFRRKSVCPGGQNKNTLPQLIPCP